MTKLPETAIPIRLISGGKIGKRDYQMNHIYMDSEGRKLDIPHMPMSDKLSDRKTKDATRYKDGYMRIRGRTRGQVIYRMPLKKCWEIEKKITASGKTPTNTYRMYLWTELDNKAEVTQMMKDIWTTRTTFPEPSTWSAKEVTILDKPLEEDQIKIMSEYVHGEGYKYVDTWKVKTTQSTLQLTKKIPMTAAEKAEYKKEGFATVKGHDYAAMRTPTSGGDRRLYTKEKQRVGRKI